MANADERLEGKTALVTGSGHGIGRQIALKLADRGAYVVATDLNGETAGEVAEEIGEAVGSGRAHAVEMDVTDLERVQHVIDETVADRGALDILINDAGIWFPKFFLESTPEEWRKEVDVCFFGVVHCTRVALPHMVDQGGGRIVSIASDAGRVGEKRQAVYSGAKAGVIGFSKAIAREYGRYNITVNCVAPGLTMNSPEMAESFGQRAGELRSVYPLYRGESEPPLGQPSDVAGAVAFLASDDAAWVTGQTISVSGGYSMA
ncbi:MAG: SDR family NAD(P)-dependent oxidoreductase [Dehalococcoidia bacterium]|nr:SDR family NAD(P)-dependent oxidoreductase [Dehalococcoidia bacterium]